VAITAPVPRPRHRFWRCRDRWMALSRHPGSCAGPRPFFSGEADFTTYPSLDALADGITRRPSLRTRPPFTRPWPPFLERVCRAYSRPDAAYRLLQRFIDVRATQPGLLILAGTEASTSFLFSSCHAPRFASRSGTWRAALRPSKPAPVLVSPTCVGLPNR